MSEYGAFSASDSHLSLSQASANAALSMLAKPEERGRLSTGDASYLHPTPARARFHAVSHPSSVSRAAGASLLSVGTPTPDLRRSRTTSPQAWRGPGRQVQSRHKAEHGYPTLL